MPKRKKLRQAYAGQKTTRTANLKDSHLTPENCKNHKQYLATPTKYSHINQQAQKTVKPQINIFNIQTTLISI